jgi:hypothetical protein
MAPPFLDICVAWSIINAMRIKTFFIITLIFICALSGFSEETLDQLVKQAIDSIEAKAPTGLVVSLGSFTYQDKKVGSSFGAFIEEKSAGVLSGSKKLKYFARDRLEEILTALELSVSDLSDPATAPKLGKLEGVAALLFGKYFNSDKNVRLSVSLVKIETGIAIGSADVLIPKSAIPTTLSILPDNYNDAMFVLNELADITGNDNATFAIKLWTVRGDGATYKDGEEMVVNFFSNKDAFLKVYHIDVEGKAQLIFPNKYYKDNFVKHGVINKIPDSRYPFTFVLGAPYGTEFIKVIASTVQFKEIEASFADLGKAKKDLFTKGLKVEEKSALTAEAVINYTIIGK